MSMNFNAAANSVSNNGGNFVAVNDGSSTPVTVVWGTCASNPTGYAYIVVSASETARVEEIDIEQCSGFEAIVILLNKGNDVEITVIDDNAINPPAIGAIVNMLNVNGASVPMLIVGNKADQARKREGMRTITAKTYNSISGLH